jgi:Uma2 family endonuclease
MAAAAFAPPEPETLADVIDGLGVPASRIRWTPRPGTATEADVLAVRTRTDRVCELVDGILVEKGMSYRASLLGAVLIRLIGDYVARRNLGLVTGEAGLLRLVAGLVRIPDLAFVAWDRVPGGVVPDAPIPGLVPNLAVEVLSPSNTAAEMARKRREYFGAGVELVWVIDPAARTAEVFTAVDRSVVLDAGQALDGGAVLPGFALPLADLFNDPQLNPRP